MVICSSGSEHLPNQYFVLQASLSPGRPTGRVGAGGGWALQKAGYSPWWALLCIGCETKWELALVLRIAQGEPASAAEQCRAILLRWKWRPICHLVPPWFIKAAALCSRSRTEDVLLRGKVTLRQARLRQVQSWKWFSHCHPLTPVCRISGGGVDSCDSTAQPVGASACDLVALRIWTFKYSWSTPLIPLS